MSTCSSISSLIGAILTRISTRSGLAGFFASGSTIVRIPRSYVAFGPVDVDLGSERDLAT